VKLPDIKVANTIWTQEGFSDANVEMDTAELEKVFGLKEREDRSSASLERQSSRKKATEAVALIDMKRTNNVQIALSRLKMTDEKVLASIKDPASSPMDEEQVNLLLAVQPTAEEIEMVMSYQGNKAELGRVEQFFLLLSEVSNLGPRLQALQISKHFPGERETLHAEVNVVRAACKQVRQSKVLMKTMETVLALGNYLNGTSNRGGAYGFKLSDLGKLVQVKSADNKITLLHYIAKALYAEKKENDKDKLAVLQEETKDLEEAKDFSMSDKKSELAKMGQQFKAVASQVPDLETTDSLLTLVSVFVKDSEQKLKQLQEDFADMEKLLKELATWVAEKPTSGPEDLLGPFSAFVKALANAQKDNIREEENERRSQLQNDRLSSGVLGKSGKMKQQSPAMGDPNMMLEMQLKMAKRAEVNERNSAAAKNVAVAVTDDSKALAAQQKSLVRQSMMKKVNSQAGLGVKMADSAASGALFAQKRAARQSTAGGGRKSVTGAAAPHMMGLKDPNKKPPMGMASLAE